MNCYNGEKYLREAMDSVFAQTFQDWEIIFWDNNSSDSTPQIAKSYGDAKVKYFRSQTLINLGEARRNAVNNSQGEWVTFIDCDDIWYPEKLIVQITALEDTNYCFAYAGIQEITSEGIPIRTVVPKYASGNVIEKLLYQFDVNMVTPIIRRSFLMDHKINFEPEITASEEYNLFIRLAAKGDVLVQKEILGCYRVNAGSLTNRQISKWAFERRYTLKQLTEENPSIKDIYKKAFTEAENRGTYYEVRYLMSICENKIAKELMHSICSATTMYMLLYVSLFVPGLWNVLHSNLNARKLKNMISFFS